MKQVLSRLNRVMALASGPKETHSTSSRCAGITNAPGDLRLPKSRRIIVTSQNRSSLWYVAHIVRGCVVNDGNAKGRHVAFWSHKYAQILAFTFP